MTREEAKAIRYVRKMAECKDPDFIDSLLTKGNEEAMKDRLDLIRGMIDVILDERQTE
jgi:hypothetical protein